MDALHLQLAALLLLFWFISSVFACLGCYHTQTAFNCIPNLNLEELIAYLLSRCFGACPTPQHVLISIFSLISGTHSLLSRCIGALSIPCSWTPSRDAHFLILELPESQRFTGPGQPTRAQQAQPPRCLQEVDGRPFVFGFYKRKFCRGLPGRSVEANTHTHNSFSFNQTETTDELQAQKLT